GNAGCEPAFSERRHYRLPEELGCWCSLCGDARRARRREALGFQRSPETEREVQGQPAITGRIPETDNAGRRFTPADYCAKRANIGRRKYFARTHPGDFRRTGRDVAGGKGFHLASGNA